MATVYAMGGGQNPDDWERTRRRLLDFTGVAQPKVLYIPPDGGEQLGYWPEFERGYRSLGCSCLPLFLLRDRPSDAQMREVIERANLIFVGGGNTRRMMRMWRRVGVVPLLEKAFEEAKVLAGVSAGAICWFQYGHSDSASFSGREDWSYIRVRGLGLLPGTFCPHVLGENRLDNFAKMIRARGGIGYGLDDGCALLIQNGEAEVMGDPKGAFIVTKAGVETLPARFPLGTLQA